jgi:hypothetical protein
VFLNNHLTVQSAILDKKHPIFLQNIKCKSSDIIILSEPNNYKDFISGKQYNRIEDPFLQLLGNRYNIQKVEFIYDPKNFEQSHRKYPSIVFPLLASDHILRKTFLNIHFLNRIKNSCVQYSTLAHHNLYIKGYPKFQLNKNFFPKKTPSHNWMLRRVLTLFSYAQSIFEILCITKPKALFLSCYYNEKGMGAALACRKFGIPCVDIQHGVQGDTNFLYCNWDDSENTEYKLLPTHHWTWHEPVKNHIAHNKYYNYVVGGNLWTLLWKCPYFLKSNIDNQNLTALISKNFPVLVTLNRLETTQALPEFVFQILAKLGDNFFWLFRTHPLMPQQQGKLKRVLKKFSIKNYEIKLSSTLPLPLILTKVKLHLTGYSAVCLEAAEMGLKSLITIPKAESLFFNEIRQGIVIPALNADQLYSALMTTYNDLSNTTGAYTSDFDFGLNRAHKAIEKILSHSPTSQSTERAKPSD